MTNSSGVVRRICPYCGKAVALQDCDVVAFDPDEVLVDLETLDEENGADSGGAGAEVLWRADRTPEPTSRDWLTRSRIGRIPDLSADFPVEKNPRRRCPYCQAVLPRDLDYRNAHIVSVVGLNVGGKTNFLGVALTLATRKSALAQYGFTEFDPDDETANRFFRDYFSPLFRKKTRLKGTQADEEVNRKPLVFRVTPPSNRPIATLIHDVAGESLMKAHVRNRVAGFLRRSSALIFILDPTEFDHVRQHVPAEDIKAATDYVDAERDIDQVDLLAHVVRELEYQFSGRPIPLAIVVGKSDLLASHGAPSVRMLTHRKPHEDPVEDLRAASSEVREFLHSIGEERILSIGDNHAATTYHAVSSLGSTPDPGGKIASLGPVRAVDPLAAVLLRLDAQL